MRKLMIFMLTAVVAMSKMLDEGVLLTKAQAMARGTARYFLAINSQ